MAKIKIKRTSDEALLVGNKVVYKDMNGDWIAVSELTQREADALAKYKTEVLDKE